MDKRIMGCVLALALAGCAGALGQTDGLQEYAPNNVIGDKALQVEVQCERLTITADRQPTFTVTIRNCSNKSLTIPAPTSFTRYENPQYREAYRQTLVPKINAPKDAPPEYTVGCGTPLAEAVAKRVVLPAGDTLRLSGLRLTEEFYFPGRPGYFSSKLATKIWRFLRPGNNYKVSFCFENQQAQIDGQDVWVGKVLSNELAFTVLPVQADNAGLAACFSLPKSKYFLGEPIYVTFKIQNKGDKAFYYEGGSRLHYLFGFEAVDAEGGRVRDPYKHSGAEGSGLSGGPGEVKPGETTPEEKLLINEHCAFDKPGKYTITCRRTLNVQRESDGNNFFPLPEDLLPTAPFQECLTINICRSDSELKVYLASLEKTITAKGYTGSDEYMHEITALATGQFEPAFATIERMARTPGPYQDEALFLLAEYGIKRSRPALMTAASDASAEVRSTALYVLNKHNQPIPVALVQAALRSKNKQERSHAVGLCSEHKYPECFDMLLAMAQDPDHGEEVVGALGAYQNPKALQVLLGFLHGRGGFTRIVAATSLKELGRNDGIPVVIELLRSEEMKFCRGNVVQALKELTGQQMQHPDDYDDWHGWWEREGKVQFPIEK